MITIMSVSRDLLSEIGKSLHTCGLIYPTSVGVYFIQGDIADEAVLRKCFKVPNEAAAISLALMEPNYAVAIHKEAR